MTTNPNNRPPHPFNGYTGSIAEREENQQVYLEWYTSLKPGDVVYYNDGYSYNSFYRKDTVAKITATGMVRTANGKLFDKNGMMRGKYSRKLYPYTEAHRTYEARRKLIHEVGKIDWKTVDDEGLRKAAELSVAYLIPEYAKKVSE